MKRRSVNPCADKAFSTNRVNNMCCTHMGSLSNVCRCCCVYQSTSSFTMLMNSYWLFVFRYFLNPGFVLFYFAFLNEISPSSTTWSLDPGNLYEPISQVLFPSLLMVKIWSLLRIFRILRHSNFEVVKNKRDVSPGNKKVQIWWKGITDNKAEWKLQIVLALTPLITPLLTAFGGLCALFKDEH